MGYKILVTKENWKQEQEQDHTVLCQTSYDNRAIKRY